MPKNTEENQKRMKEKLNFLGLNLERVPKVLKEFEPFSFRPLKSYDDTSYKVYRYIPINKIEILLTPTDRLTDLNQKYKLAAPVGAYLDAKSENNIERFATFLKMLNDLRPEEIEKVEKEQEKLHTMLPYEVKYPNNYIWQIYYSDISDQYFMLVPTNETNNNAFFYLLKKKIEASKSRKSEYIFTPITHQEYSGKFLVASQIADLENYLWYFTKEWPNIYEVYDAKERMTLKIVGKANIYGDVKSDYVITLESKEQALECYKLIKALFILATGLPDNYRFQVGIAEDGGLEFWNDSKVKMEYETLPFFIKDQSNEKRNLITLEDKKLAEEQEKLQELKQITEKQTEEFLNKERQIATFLACKKSFFGKIKYYIGNRKKHFGTVESYKLKTKVSKKKERTITEEEKIELKENYTIEDLIEICTKLDSRKKVVKNLQMDRKALELKKVNLDRKIKNANIYLNEIELHKKSIFEFWKFSNKDELPSLNEGEEETNNEKEKIGKSFNFENDIEDLGKKMDEIQRRKLSKNEIDAIFAIKQVLSSSQILNKTRSKELSEEQLKQLQEELEKLKEEYEDNIEVIQVKDFDIFGGMSEDQTKVKLLHNEKHREVEKDKYKVLNITSNTELDVYIDNLRNDLKLVKESYNKISTPFETTIYIAQEGELDKNNLQVANLNATETVYKKAEELLDKEEPINFYTISIPQDSPLIYYTNIIFFDNFNQTLPQGMDVSTEVLVDLKKYQLEKQNIKNFRINYQLDEYTNKVVEVHVVSYKANYKK